MKEAEQVCVLIDKKRELFLEYERETQGIIEGNIEDAAAHMKRRTELQEEIDSLDREIADVCGGDADSLLFQAARTHCAREELSEELCCVFDAAMQLRTVVRRIQDAEPHAAERLTSERDMLLEKIRGMNQGGQAAASRYSKMINTPKGIGMPSSRGNL